MILYRKLVPAVFLCLAMACTPENDDSRTIVNLNVSINVEQTVLFTEDDADDAGYYRRFVAEVYMDGEAVPVQRKTFVYNDVNADGEMFRLPVPLRVGKGGYKVAVWTDLIRKKTDKDVFYVTSDLQKITHLTPYQGNVVYKDALAGSAALTVGSSDEMSLEVPMYRALAPVRIAAADYDNFVSRHGKDVAAQSEVRINVINAPSGFDAVRMEPSGTFQNMAFTVKLADAAKTDDGHMLALDYIFTGSADSFVEMNLEVLDGAGNSLNRTDNFTVALKRGFITTVRGNFLTSESGLQIETGFEEDIIVDIDPIEPEPEV